MNVIALSSVQIKYRPTEVALGLPMNGNIAGFTYLNSEISSVFIISYAQ